MNIQRPILTALLLLAMASTAIAQDLEYLDSTQWTFNQDCTARGDTIVTTLHFGLQVWDAATDPANPTMLTDHYFNAEKALSVDWEGDLIAATTQSGRILLLDAADPSQLSEYPQLTGFGVYTDLRLERRGAQRLGFVAGSGGFVSLDLTDPSAPTELQNLDLDGSPSSIGGAGDTLVVLAKYDGIHVVDVGDPAAMTLLGSYPLTDTHLLNVSASGDLAAVALRQGGFRVFDVSDPAAIVETIHLLPTVDGGAVTVRDLFLDGTTLYLGTDQEGVVTYDLTNPYAPVQIGYDPDPYYSTNDLHFGDGRIYMTHWGLSKDGIHVIDVSDPANPASLGHTQAWDFSRFADVENRVVYTSMGHMGSFAHEYVEGVGFEYRGGFFVLNSWGVDVVDGRAYIASTAEGLVIADWSDPTNAIELGRDNVGVARAVHVPADSIAYMSVYNDGLVTVDVSDPAAPVVLDRTSLPLQSVAVFARGALAATADRDAGMNLWDVSDPANIVQLGNFPVADKALDVELMPGQDIAYLASTSNGVYVIDISDPMNPIEIDNLSVFAQGVWVEGVHLHVATNGAGVSSFRLDDPAHPTLLAEFNTPSNAQTLVSEDGILYVSDYSGLVGLRLNDPTAAPDTTPFFADLGLANYPNPFNPRTEIRFELPEPGRVGVAIFDIAGRRLATLHSGAMAAGAHTIPWRGKDDRGNELPSGVYFARIGGLGDSGAPLVAARKLTLLR